MAVGSNGIHFEAVILDGLKQHSPIWFHSTFFIASFEDQGERLVVAIRVISGPIVDYAHLDLIKHDDTLKVKLHHVLVLMSEICHLVVVETILGSVFELVPLSCLVLSLNLRLFVTGPYQLEVLSPIIKGHLLLNFFHCIYIIFRTCLSLHHSSNRRNLLWLCFLLFTSLLLRGTTTYRLHSLGTA